MRLVACSITAWTEAWVPSSRSALKKSHARIGLAWERRNCDQLGPVRRGAGSIPVFFIISHAVDVAFFPGRQAGRATLLLRAADEILGTQRASSSILVAQPSARPVRECPHAVADVGYGKGFPVG